MTISQKSTNKYNNELKTNLAKLMAQEDLQVVHQAIDTAAFNTKERILHLPTWENVSDDLFNMLISHEIGHALHTPDTYGDSTVHPEFNICPSGYINIVEDARIEKLVKSKYPGVVRAFINGYKELMTMPSFEIEDVNSLGLIDRINLFYKGGSMLGIKFADVELQFLTKVGNVISFQDAIDVSVEIYNFVKENTPEQDQDQEQGNADGGHGETSDEENDDLYETPNLGSSIPQEEKDSDEDGDSEDGDSEDGDSDEDGDSKDGDSDEGDSDEGDSDDDTDGKSSTTLDENADDSENDAESSTTGSGKESDLSKDSEEDSEEDETESSNTSRTAGKTSNSTSPPIEETITSDLFDSAINGLDKITCSDSIPVSCNIPDFKLEDWVVNWKEVHTIIDLYYNDGVGDFHSEQKTKYKKEQFDNFNQYQTDNAKIVNYLAKEFEMKKAAEMHKNTTVAKTGKINISKVYKYQVSEDIFLRKNVIKDGKNHGLIMLIDWSASMAGNIQDAIHQVINLATFAKRVGIPFEVYGFGAHGSYSNKTPEGTLHALSLGHERLRQYLSNTMSSPDFRNAVINLLTIANRFEDGSYFGRSSIPAEEQLGGTPLNENLLRIGKFISNFKLRNSIEKVNLVIMTDGASSKLDGYYDSIYGQALYPTTAQKYLIRDKKSFMTYEIDATTAQRETNSLLEMISLQHGINIIGFYICGTTRELKYAVAAYVKKDSANSWSRHYIDKDEWSTARKLYNKQKYLEATVTGFSKYFIIPGKKNTEVREMKVGMTNSQLKNAFTKKLNSDKDSRIVLSKFIALIA